MHKGDSIKQIIVVIVTIADSLETLLIAAWSNFLGFSWLKYDQHKTNPESEKKEDYCRSSVEENIEPLANYTFGVS